MEVIFAKLQWNLEGDLIILRLKENFEGQNLRIAKDGQLIGFDNQRLDWKHDWFRKQLEEGKRLQDVAENFVSQVKQNIARRLESGPVRLRFAKPFGRNQWDYIKTALKSLIDTRERVPYSDLRTTLVQNGHFKQLVQELHGRRKGKGKVWIWNLDPDNLAQPHRLHNAHRTVSHQGNLGTKDYGAVLRFYFQLMNANEPPKLMSTGFNYFPDPEKYSPFQPVRNFFPFCFFFKFGMLITIYECFRGSVARPPISGSDEIHLFEVAAAIDNRLRACLALWIPRAVYFNEPNFLLQVDNALVERWEELMSFSRYTVNGATYTASGLNAREAVNLLLRLVGGGENQQGPVWLEPKDALYVYHPMPTGAADRMKDRLTGKIPPPQAKPVPKHKLDESASYCLLAARGKKDMAKLKDILKQTQSVADYSKDGFPAQLTRYMDVLALEAGWPPKKCDWFGLLALSGIVHPMKLVELLMPFLSSLVVTTDGSSVLWNPEWSVLLRATLFQVLAQPPDSIGAARGARREPAFYRMGILADVVFQLAEKWEEDWQQLGQKLSQVIKEIADEFVSMITVVTEKEYRKRLFCKKMTEFPAVKNTDAYKFLFENKEVNISDRIFKGLWGALDNTQLKKNMGNLHTHARKLSVLTAKKELTEEDVNLLRSIQKAQMEHVLDVACAEATRQCERYTGKDGASFKCASKFLMHFASLKAELPRNPQDFDRFRFAVVDFSQRFVGEISVFLTWDNMNRLKANRILSTKMRKGILVRNEKLHFDPQRLELDLAKSEKEREFEYFNLSTSMLLFANGSEDDCTELEKFGEETQRARRELTWAPVFASYPTPQHRPQKDFFVHIPLPVGPIMQGSALVHCRAQQDESEAVDTFTTVAFGPIKFTAQVTSGCQGLAVHGRKTIDRNDLCLAMNYCGLPVPKGILDLLRDLEVEMQFASDGASLSLENLCSRLEYTTGPAVSFRTRINIPFLKINEDVALLVQPSMLVVSARSWSAAVSDEVFELSFRDPLRFPLDFQGGHQVLASVRAGRFWHNCKEEPRLDILDAELLLDGAPCCLDGS